MAKGGYRPGAGRKLGSVTKKTLEKRKAEEALHQRIVGAVDRLFNAQLALAEGMSFLYRVDEVGEGKNKRREHVLVTDPEEIKQYLDGEYNTEEDYYYIQTKSPDNKAIDSMFDRVFGKAVTRLGNPDGDDLQIGVVMLPTKNASTLATTRKTGDSPK